MTIQVWKHRHPGSGRHRSSAHPKGRQVDPEALEEIRSLLGERPRRRDLLIEHLHLIQDRYHCLSGAHLAALAEEMLMALSEVFEVASSRPFAQQGTYLFRARRQRKAPLKKFLKRWGCDPFPQLPLLYCLPCRLFLPIPLARDRKEPLPKT